jgi:hypothetical protein
MMLRMARGATDGGSMEIWASRLWSVASVFWIALVWWFNIGYAPTAEYVLTASDGQQYVIYAPEKGAAVSAIEAYLERHKSALPSKGPDPWAQYVQPP